MLLIRLNGLYEIVHDLLIIQIHIWKPKLLHAASIQENAFTELLVEIQVHASLNVVYL
jgi:hypothetical protein